MGKKLLDPLYTDEPEEHYLVVINPWGMVSNRQRKQLDIDCCGAWLRAIFGLGPGIVEAIYVMDTREEVIVRLAPEADHEIGLGVHDPRKFLSEEFLNSIQDGTVTRRWKDIFRVEYLTGLSRRVVPAPSYIFEYNWSRHGDPARRQWKEFFPTSRLPPSNFPVKLPYPEARWSPFPLQCVDQRLSSMLIPMAQKQEEDFFGNEEDPDQYKESKIKVDGQEKHPSSSSSKLGKRDPHEREEDDKHLLHGITGSIKDESTDDAKPSVALVNAYNEYRREHGPTQQTSGAPGIKEERDIKPDVSRLSQDDDAPSEVLRRVYDEYTRSTGDSPGGASSQRSDPQKRNVKVEHDDTRHLHNKRIKLEPVNRP